MPFCCNHFMDTGHLINKLLVFDDIETSFSCICDYIRASDIIGFLRCTAMLKGLGHEIGVCCQIIWRPSLFLISSLDEFLIPFGPFIPGPI
jgi:hypothetical protein